MSTVEVFQESDGRWRWEYRDEHADLKSNRTYGDRDSAMHAARMAYPAHFGDESRQAQGSAGFVVQLLAIVLVIVVWKRRRRAVS